MFSEYSDAGEGRELKGSVWRGCNRIYDLISTR